MDGSTLGVTGGIIGEGWANPQIVELTLDLSPRFFDPKAKDIRHITIPLSFSELFPHHGPLSEIKTK